ncbi:MAG: hypothetical protein LBL63_06375, partial [Clostridiales Family XIII bacterium]|nr:hypothetical protein [Clostridiales Family XIII bacterium]
ATLTPAKMKIFANVPFAGLGSAPPPHFASEALKSQHARPASFRFVRPSFRLTVKNFCNHNYIKADQESQNV